MKVDLLGSMYKLSFVERLLSEDDTHVGGLYSWFERSIKINKADSLDAQNHTIWHELGHGIEHHTGRDWEEQDVDAFATMMNYLFKHDPGFIQYMLDRSLKAWEQEQ